MRLQELGQRLRAAFRQAQGHRQLISSGFSAEQSPAVATKETLRSDLELHTTAFRPLILWNLLVVKSQRWLSSKVWESGQLRQVRNRESSATVAVGPNGAGIGSGNNTDDSRLSMVTVRSSGGGAVIGIGTDSLTISQVQNITIAVEQLMSQMMDLGLELKPD
jgi:hypothetical protein